MTDEEYAAAKRLRSDPGLKVVAGSIKKDR